MRLLCLLFTYSFFLLSASMMPMEWQKDLSPFQWSDEEPSKPENEPSSGDSLEASNSSYQTTFKDIKNDFQEMDWDEFIESTLCSDAQKEFLKNCKEDIESKKKLTAKIRPYFKNAQYQKIQDLLEINRCIDLPTLKNACVEQFELKLHDRKFVSSMLENGSFLAECHTWKSTQLPRIPECVFGLLKCCKLEKCDSKPSSNWIQEIPAAKKTVPNKQIEFTIRGAQFTYPKLKEIESMIWADATQDSQFVVLSCPKKFIVFDAQRNSSIIRMKPYSGIRKIEFITNNRFLCLFKDGDLVEYNCPEGKILKAYHNIANFQKHPIRSYYLAIDPLARQCSGISFADGFTPVDSHMKFSSDGSYLKISFLLNKHQIRRGKKYFSLNQLHALDDMIQKPICLGKLFIIASAIKHRQSINLTKNKELQEIFHQLPDSIKDILKSSYRVRTETSTIINSYDSLLDRFKNIF